MHRQPNVDRNLHETIIFVIKCQACARSTALCYYFEDECKSGFKDNDFFLVHRHKNILILLFCHLGCRVEQSSRKCNHMIQKKNMLHTHLKRAVVKLNN